MRVGGSGRLWACTASGIAVLENGKWRLAAKERLDARTIAEGPDGRILLGASDGRILEIDDGIVKATTTPAGMTASSAFLIADHADGGLWLANRGFIGRLAGKQWQPTGQQPSTRADFVAGPARMGGLWVYYGGTLYRYQIDGRVETFARPGIDQPREVCEDHNGRVWIASMSRGLIGVLPGTATLALTATNGLDRAVRFVFEDAEDNLWAGTSSGGLYRLKPRYFQRLGLEQGLPDRIVRTVAEESPGRMVVGTHGGGTARIHNGRVVWTRPIPRDNRGIYAWSVLCDRRGRTWTGTYGNGLLVETNGVERSFPLPREVGTSVCALLEDSQGRIWVGGTSGLGVIEGDQARLWHLGPSVTNFNVRAIVENRSAGVLWVGTTYRVLRVDTRRPGQVSILAGLPRDRVTAMALDADGCLWIGFVDQGLFCIRDGKVTPVGRAQGLPAKTIGSLLEDGKGYWWLGSDRGILRVRNDDLHRAIDQAEPLSFNVFNQSDGLETSECTASFQPAAARDAAGRLWFTTIRGVVTVDPAHLRLNTRPPPVVIERLTLLDRTGTHRTHALPFAGPLTLPAGCTDLEFRYAALSYSAPEKVLYAYRLEGTSGGWVQAGNRRQASFHALSPGHYRLQVRAANNDGLWNETGATVAFSVQPFLWQTFWFQGLAAAALTAGVGFGGWRLARARYQRQVERLQAQRALEQEQSRLAAVMDATSDLVAFADRNRKLLYLNPAGRRLLGFQLTEDIRSLRLTDIFPPWAANRIDKEGIPMVERQGTWEAELALLRRDGQEIPISQVLAAQRDATGQVGFLSTIARDISERKRADEEKDRLNAQLAQAQKIESVGRLAGGVAHDFNNMLQVILGNVDLIMAQTPPAP